MDSLVELVERHVKNKDLNALVEIKTAIQRTRDSVC